jgi:hypothetical protein
MSLSDHALNVSRWDRVVVRETYQLYRVFSGLHSRFFRGVSAPHVAGTREKNQDFVTTSPGDCNNRSA